MCCLFGMLDFTRSFTTREKNRILNVLSKECEVRGTDATGISYNYKGMMKIYKRPIPARKLKIRLPEKVYCVMGHTRLTTQGTEKDNFNNHPFQGRCGNTTFSLAHNGVLNNDKQLILSESLPSTNIKTDSYVAVQLLEKQKILKLDTIKSMAEKVSGTFAFTVLDSSDNLYIVKGESPFVIHKYDDFLIYASTEEILSKAEKKLKLTSTFEKIRPKCGDILKFDRFGKMEESKFDTTNLINQYSSYKYLFSYNFDYESYYGGSIEDGEYVDDLKEIAKAKGITDDVIDILLEFGYCSMEIEEMLYDDELLHECLSEVYDCYSQDYVKIPAV